MGLVYSPKYRVFIKTSYYQSVNFHHCNLKSKLLIPDIKIAGDAPHRPAIQKSNTNS